MHFDVEIYFSGLCFFEFEYCDQDRRCIPKSCTVVLVDATKSYKCQTGDDLGSKAPGIHTPRLIVPAKNLIIGSQDVHAFPLTVSGLGEDLIEINLEGARVQFEPSDGYSGPLYVPRQRRQGRFATPDDSGARMEWYDWVSLMHEIEPDLRALKPYRCTARGDCGQCEEASGCGQPIGPAISYIQFCQGDVENLELGTNRGDHLVFDFRKVCDQDLKGACYSRCLSDRMVLRFRGLTRPLEATVTRWTLDEASRLKAEHDVFGIGASRPELETHGPVEASVTNLDKTYHVTQRAIYDFLWFYELFEWKRDQNCTEQEKPVEDRIIPWPQVHKYSGRTPSSGNCPPSGS